MLPTLDGPELVFGICSPIGTKNGRIVNLLQETLSRLGYGLERFKVTDLMKSISITDMLVHDSPIEERYDSYIKYANKLRELTETQEILAILCCAAIRAFRSKLKSTTYVKKQAYVFDQFKREEEIQLLRQVYGPSFVLISIHSKEYSRIQYLATRISRDHALSRPDIDHEQMAKRLIRRDQDEQGEYFGQRLRDTFPLADLFVDGDDLDGARKHLSRFLDLFFGSNKHSPSKHEYGMSMAKNASLRSLDLSRQVGAAIFKNSGEIISLGCNEVPKANGGTYWCDDGFDQRDYVKEGDENQRIKKAILADIVRRLQQSEVMSETKSLDEIITFVMREVERKGSPISDAQLMDLVEFGRVIHAEMSAISDAARLGLSVRDCVLFCTTFPCHICAKHIVAAGIREVLYIEPYPKSYAEPLHSDSISIEENAVGPSSKVSFRPFIGVAPLRYRELFERGRRKDRNGTFRDWADGIARPYVKYTVANYMNNETAITDILDKKLEDLRIKNLVTIK